MIRSLALTLLLASWGAAAEGRFSPADVWLWRTLSEPRISPDGQQVAYVESWNDRAANAVRSNLWIAPEGGDARQFTAGEWRDWSPRFSPDGLRLAWMSDRGGQPGVWTRPLGAGPEKRIAAVDQTPLELAWSPDGAWIAFTARARDLAPAPAWAPPSILPRLALEVFPRTRVYVVSAEGGPARVISGDDTAYSADIAWMPGGQWVLAVRDGEICALRPSGDGMRQLTRGERRFEAPVPSPDGSKIACLARDSKQRDYVVRKLYVMNADGSRLRPLSGSLDRDAVEPRWSSDSRTVYFLADDSGATHVYAARNDGSLRRVTEGRERLYGFSLSDGGRAAVVSSGPAAAMTVATFDLFSPEERATLASPNSTWIAERSAGAVEEIRFGSDGVDIQAWIIKPPDFDATKKYPLFVDVSDAPRVMYGAEFNLRAQILVSAGFVVLCANPRGAPGYGEEFGNPLRTRMPGDDFDDLMRGISFVEARGYIDSRRIAIGGGITAAWAIGHTARFAAAVMRRAGVWAHAEPWQDPELFTARSPIFFARKFQTPTLVLAAPSDPESWTLYDALRRTKVDTALVRLEDGGPAELVLEMEATLAWLGRLKDQ